MGRKRGNNEGSVFRRKNGTWVAQVSLGFDSEGKPKRAYFYAKTREEANEKLIKALAELQHGIPVEPGKLTVGQWLTKWLNERARGTVRQTTWDSYKTIIEQHLCPAFGTIPLKKLTPTAITDFYNGLAKEGSRLDEKQGGLSKMTIRKIHVVLHHALEQAIKEGLLVRNPADAAVPPKIERKEPRILTLAEQQQLLAALEGERLEAAFILLMATGLRRGELLALRWNDVDFKQGLIHVSRNLVVARNQPGERKTKLVFEQPKTTRGRRDVAVPEEAMRALKAHKARQNEEKLFWGESYKDNGLVFASQLGTPIDPANLNRTFNRILKKAGLGHYNLHSLRHSYASRLLELGEHPKTVAELLGHSQVSVTLDTYSHVLPELKKNAAARLNDLLKSEYVGAKK